MTKGRWRRWCLCPLGRSLPESLSVRWHMYVVDVLDPGPDGGAGGARLNSLCEAARHAPRWIAAPTARRVAALAGDGIAQSAFQTCTVTLGVDGGTAAQVAIRYNTCGR